jgi:hypothetical protein
MPKHKRRHNPTTRATPLAPDKLERILYGTTLPDAHTKQRLEQARSNNMPDIKTALQAALTKQEKLMDINTLNEWDKGTADSKAAAGAGKKIVSRFPVTNNITRTVFNHVRDNPGTTFAKAVAALPGYKVESISSLLSQMSRQGMLRREGSKARYNYYAAIPEFRALKTASQKKKQAPAPTPTVLPIERKRVVVIRKGTAPGNSTPPNAPAGLAALKADTVQVSGTHYKDMPVQPWSVMESVLSHEEFVGFLKGNIIKYSMRAGRKPGSDDAGKAQHYQQKLKEITQR